MGSALAIPTKPTISANSQFDITLENIFLNITFATDNETQQVTHVLFINNLSSQNVSTSPIQLILSEGNYTLYVCAYGLNSSNCSDSINMQIINGTVPMIGSVPTMAIVPIYGDLQQSRRIFELIVDDPNQESLNVSMVADGDDVYGDDFTNRTQITCNEVTFTNNKHHYNCTILASSIMQPGYYDIDVYANNSFKSSSKKFDKALMVYHLLSANFTTPTINFNNTYNGWVDAEEPIIIKNTGNTLFSVVAVTTNVIQCDGYTFPVDYILIGARDNRAAARVCSNETQFDFKMNRGESRELYVFIQNQDDREPNNCRYIWGFRLKYVFEEVPT
jgi:hypothetical protein